MDQKSLVHVGLGKILLLVEPLGLHLPTFSIRSTLSSPLHPDILHCAASCLRLRSYLTRLFKMLRNALKQSSRAIGAVSSTTGRAAIVSFFVIVHGFTSGVVSLQTEVMI